MAQEHMSINCLGIILGYWEDGSWLAEEGESSAALH